MRQLLRTLVIVVLTAAVTTAAPKPRVSTALADDLSFRNEIQRAIDRGLAWLQTNQNTNGYWSTADTPAVTALALMAFKGEPGGRYDANEPAWLNRGYQYLLDSARPDGAIYRTNLPNYNTAISLLALVTAQNPEYERVILKARQFLIGLQSDFGEKGKIDDPLDGGVGYGSRYPHSDMSNTMQALEALYYSRHLARDAALADARDLNWEAVIQFIQNCQNLPDRNKLAWVSDSAKDRGGFVYYPGHSMAGGETNSATGRVALRSYASISYAGLLSYIYAQLKRDDPRVLAVYDWLRKNYTLEENPGMGAQGKFYYYHTMAKALTTHGVDEIELANGQKVNWRKDLAMKLLNEQGRDGSWINEEHARWWEKDPALVTSYAVLALEMIYRGIHPAAR